jgi:hypothetical protein
MRSAGRGVRRLPQRGKVAIKLLLHGDENTVHRSRRMTSNACFWPQTTPEERAILASLGQTVR